MSQVLHTPNGDVKIKTEEEKAAEAMQELTLQAWTLDAKPYQTASVDWTQVQNDEIARTVLDNFAEMTASMVLARVMHHGIRTKTPPSKVHVTVQVVTETEDGQLLSIEEIDESELAIETTAHE